MPADAPRSRRWTRDEYYRLDDLGFFEGERVELVNGLILQIPPITNTHAAGISLMQDALRTAFGQGYWIRTRAPLVCNRFSEPEPDLAIVPGGPRDYRDHPTTALLVVEVTHGTRFIDRLTKGRLYARSGIPDFWILNLVDRQLEVYRDPRPSPARPAQRIYSQVTTLQAADSVTPLAAPQAKIAVADLLP